MEWEGTATDLEEVRTALGNRTDDLVLSIDIGDQLLARVGFECFPGALAAEVKQWKPLLDGLVDAGLCSDAKRSALLEWPGYTTPEEIDGDWPDAMIVDSLLSRPDELSVLGRRLNHVKLVCEPGRRLQAKAYYGFGPLRLAASGGTARPAGRPSSVASGVLPADVAVLLAPATHAAADFLAVQRGENGMWRDFAAVMGGSDEWVTAYVGCSLAELADESSQRLAEQAWDSLVGRREAVDGWASMPRCQPTPTPRPGPCISPICWAAPASRAPRQPATCSKLTSSREGCAATSMARCRPCGAPWARPT